MTTLAVRFDQELGVAHRVGSGFLPCPQAVVVTRYQQRTVEPCEREWGHEGACTAKSPVNSFYRRSRHFLTTCGLDLDALPFVIAPHGLPACPDCFSTDLPQDYVVEEGLFA